MLMDFSWVGWIGRGTWSNYHGREWEWTYFTGAYEYSHKEEDPSKTREEEEEGTKQA